MLKRLMHLCRYTRKDMHYPEGQNLLKSAAHGPSIARLHNTVRAIFDSLGICKGEVLPSPNAFHATFPPRHHCKQRVGPYV